MSDKADWLKNATLGSPTPSRPVTLPGSDADRIEAARSLAIQSVRQSAIDGFGSLAGHSPAYVVAYFREWNGQPSCWLAGHIYFLARLIETQMAGKLLPIGGSESYDGATGIFDSLNFTLTELTAAYRPRILELGLAEPLIEEWLTTVHPYAEEREFYALDFESRMKRFRRDW